MIQPHRRVLLKHRQSSKDSDTGRDRTERRESDVETDMTRARETGVHALTGSLPSSSWKRYKPSFPTLEAVHSRSPIILWDEPDGSYNKTI